MSSKLPWFDERWESCGHAQHPSPVLLTQEHLRAIVEFFAQEATTRERKRVMQIVDLATREHCSCGGAGPGEGCRVCDLYHDLEELRDDQ